MEDIITNEFIAYKSGFVDGKCEVLTQIVENEGTDVFVKESFSKEEESWYSKGYDDGYNYYLNIYLKTKEFPLEGNRSYENEAVKNCFTNRVVEFNNATGKEVPVAKFRI